MARKPLIAGNWKMNGLQAARAEARKLVESLGGVAPADADILICPPATLVADMARELEGSGVATGGQDCHAAESGAHTGDVSAEMLADAGAAYVIVGHSERRADHGEDDAHVCEKAKAALRAGLSAIVCVGESEAQREKGVQEDVVEVQLDGSVPKAATGSSLAVAYEPVWAIGTGKTPSLDDIAAMHAWIRERLHHILGDEAENVRILYGGSVKPGNAAEILRLEQVDGALVGGASLKAPDFIQIIQARQSG